MNTTYSSKAEARSALRSADERRKKALATAREIADRAAKGDERPSDHDDYFAANDEYDRQSKIMHEVRAYLDDRETEDAFDAAARKSGRGTKDSSAMTELRYGKPLPAGAGFVDLYDEKRTIEDTGRYLEALIRNDYATLAEMRATLTTGAATKGAEFVNPELAAPLLDMARANTVLVKAGAQVVPLRGNTTKFPRHDGDLVLAARDEAGAVAATDVTLGSVTLTPRSYMAMAKVSREMLADSSVDVPNYLAAVAADAVAVMIDQQGLYGSGVAPIVKGLKSMTSLTINHAGADGAALTNYDAVIDLVARVKAKNYPVTAILSRPNVVANFGKLRIDQGGGAGTGVYLPKPEYLQGIPWLETSSIPTNLTVGGSGAVTTDMFAGDFSQLLIGVREDLNVKVYNELYAGTGEIGVQFSIRWDIQPVRIAALECLDGIID